MCVVVASAGMPRPKSSAAVPAARLVSELVFKRRIVIRRKAAEVQSMFNSRRNTRTAKVTTSVPCLLLGNP